MLKQQFYIQLLFDVVQHQVLESERYFMTQLVNQHGYSQKQLKVIKFANTLQNYYNKWLMSTLSQVRLAEGGQWKNQYFLAQAGSQIQHLLRKKRVLLLKQHVRQWKRCLVRSDRKNEVLQRFTELLSDKYIRAVFRQIRKMVSYSSTHVVLLQYKQMAKIDTMLQKIKFRQVFQHWNQMVKIGRDYQTFEDRVIGQLAKYPIINLQISFWRMRDASRNLFKKQDNSLAHQLALLQEEHDNLKRLCLDKDSEIQEALMSIDRLTTSMTNTVTTKLFYILERNQRSLLSSSFFSLKQHTRLNQSFDQYL